MKSQSAVHRGKHSHEYTDYSKEKKEPQSQSAVHRGKHSHSIRGVQRSCLSSLNPLFIAANILTL